MPEHRSGATCTHSILRGIAPHVAQIQAFCRRSLALPGMTRTMQPMLLAATVGVIALGLGSASPIAFSPAALAASSLGRATTHMRAGA